MQLPSAEMSHRELAARSRLPSGECKFVAGLFGIEVTRVVVPPLVHFMMDSSPGTWES
jgi:hypothetical protein